MNTDYILSRVCPALESGEYAQTTKALRRTTGYCCLGVMVDLAFRDGLVSGRWDDWEVDGDRFAAATADDRVVAGPDEDQGMSVDLLPDAVREALGFAHEEGPMVVIGGGTYVSLSEANDDGRTFAEIAAALRNLAEAERATTTR